MIKQATCLIHDMLEEIITCRHPHMSNTFYSLCSRHDKRDDKAGALRRAQSIGHFAMGESADGQSRRSPGPSHTQGWSPRQTRSRRLQSAMASATTSRREGFHGAYPHRPQGLCYALGLCTSSAFHLGIIGGDLLVFSSVSPAAINCERSR